jgi:hypothetical protein
MSDEFCTSLDAVAVSDRAALRGIVEGAELRHYRADWSDLSRSEVHVGAPAPTDLLQGRMVTAADLARAIDRVVPRWRLDVIQALEDYLT